MTPFHTCELEPRLLPLVLWSPMPTYRELQNIKVPHCTIICPQSKWPPTVSSAASSRVYYSQIEVHMRCLMTDDNAGEIPSMKLYDSDKTFAFLDINPLVGQAGNMASQPRSTQADGCTVQRSRARNPQIPRREAHRHPRRAPDRAPPRRLPDREGLRRRELQHPTEQRPDRPPGRRPRPCAHDPETQRAGRPRCRLAAAAR